jgi:hypothetical protein
LWVPNKKAAPSIASSFNAVVTMSDWAFGLMLLEMHREDWVDPAKRGKDAERTRKGQMKCVKHYHDFFKELSLRDKELRQKKSRKATDEQVDEWLLSQAETVEMGRSENPIFEENWEGDDEVYSAKIFGDLQAVNPYLQNIEMREAV